MSINEPIRILAISGSLRRVSSNTALVRAAVALAPGDVEVRVYADLASVPPFNPDLDDDNTPEPVTAFRTAIASSDAVLISSPEYAHGVSGVLKNALDWIVGSGEIVDKPVALVNTSPRATHAQMSLSETLRVMSANVVEDASLVVRLAGRHLDESGIVGDAELSRLIESVLSALARTAAATRPSSD